MENIKQRSNLCAVLRWMEEKDSGDISLDLLGIYSSAADAACATRDDQAALIDILDKDDPEFERSSIIGMEYQRDSNHDQYWSTVKINATSISQPEFQYLLEYARNAAFENKSDCERLRCLWTAYVMHRDLEIASPPYTYHIMKLLHIILGRGIKVWTDLNDFENFMCSNLM